jgi:hypothetical protein
MDPITAALVTALAMGVAGGLTETGKQLMPDAYNALKAALQQKVGVGSDLLDAVDSLEKKPDSQGRAATLQEEVQAAGADKDPDLLKLAESLQAALQQSGAGQQATLSGSGAIAQGGSTAAAATGQGSTAIGSVGGDVTLGREVEKADDD